MEQSIICNYSRDLDRFLIDNRLTNDRKIELLKEALSGLTNECASNSTAIDMASMSGGYS